MARFEVPGATLDYTETGAGRAVFELHGLTSSRANSATTGMSFSSALASDRRAIAYDARAHGRSTGRACPQDYRWDHLADDLLALMDALSPAEAVDAVGASMGVGTILNAVTRRPERFRRLVLVIPPTAWELRAGQSQVYADSADFVEQQGLRRFVAASRFLPPPPALRDLRSMPPPDVPEDLLPSLFRGAGMSDLPALEAISQIEQPVLILAWVDDPSHPTQVAEQLFDLLPDVELSVARTPDDLRAWPQMAADHLAD